MTDPTPHNPSRRGIVPSQSPAPSRAEKISKTLDAIDEAYLAPFRAFERLGAKVREPGSPPPTWEIISTFWLQRIEGGAIRSEEEREREIALLQAKLAQANDPELVADAYDALVRHRASINQAQNRTIVGLMLDAFPNARAHSPQAWMESVVKEVRVSEFSTLVVAKACNLLIRSETFAPSVGAVVERCELVVEFVDAAIAGVDRGRLQRRYYDLCIDWLKQTPVWDGNRDNRPELLKIDLGSDPFASPRRDSVGRVSWV